ncbi:atrial natriuretic peptide receptor 2-like [Heteronotia binoei]|uniref:atrial natriuretic peptide receptor 2-like n=1 Tax=Heteronotia binoei TaxID=13085 RepID=UPI00292D0C51|nr:atrial natriuretic peptide receptor 2-like [Heteronotia binoei]
MGFLSSLFHCLHSIIGNHGSLKSSDSEVNSGRALKISGSGLVSFQQSRETHGEEKGASGLKAGHRWAFSSGSCLPQPTLTLEGADGAAAPTPPCPRRPEGAQRRRPTDGLSLQSRAPRPMAAPPLLLEALLVTLLGAPSSTAAPTEVRLGVLLPGRNVGYPWAWPRVQPALSLAREALEPQLRHQGLALRTAFASTEDADGKCDSGLPLLRAGAYRRGEFYNRTVYGGPAGPDLRAFLAQLLGHFNWTSRALLVVSPKRDHLQYYSRLLSLQEELAAVPSFTALTHYYKQAGEAVHFTQANGRVVFIYGSLEMLQEIMGLAQTQNMTSGDYIFIYVDIFGESLRAEGHREAAKPWQSKESQDAGGLREAFQTVLVVTPHEPQTPEYRRFQSQLILRAQRDFGVAVNDSMGTVVAVCFHDVLLLYLRALNETLQEGGTKRDTSRILEKMRGLEIQGVTGTVSLNSKYDREMDFDLWAMKDVESGEYQVVAHYMGPEKRIKWLGPIHWKKGRPPLDNPDCVFNMDGLSSGKSGCVQG